MGFYARRILPRIVHFTCSMKPAMRQREKVVPLARGRVLEIGIGSGLNLPFYDPNRVSCLWGLDPSAETWNYGRKARVEPGFHVEFVEGSAEAIPLDAGSVDTVVITYTLCTIPDAVRAVEEVRRVLRTGGELLFCEHGAAPDESVRKWQDRLNPLWSLVGGGCNMNRPIPVLLERGGMRIRNMDTMYLPGWKPASFNYWGAAV